MILIEGMHTESADGVTSRLADIVINPTTWSVTHLVVEPAHHHEQARLVPFTAVGATDSDRLQLTWTDEQITTAPQVERTEHVSNGDSPWLHHSGLADWSGAHAIPFLPFAAVSVGWTPGGEFGDGHHHVVGENHYDAVPRSTVEISPTASVVSVDGHVVGHVGGFTVDHVGGITHLILERGHLWGHGEIAIPCSDIASATDNEVQLRVNRRHVGEYHHHHRLTV